MSSVANLVNQIFERAFPVCAEDEVDFSRAEYLEDGGDDDDSGYDYAPAA